MQRTRIDDREALKTRYIDEAERIIAAEGSAALTARRLAGEIGVAVGTTYNLFVNLDEIVVAVNARTLDRLADAVSVEPVNDRPVEEALIALAGRYLDFVRGNRNLWLLIFEGEPDGKAAVSFPNQPRFEALFELVEDVLKPLFGDAAECARSARVLWAGLHGISMLALGGRIEPLGVNQAEELVETLVNCHIAGLRTGKNDVVSRRPNT